MGDCLFDSTEVIFGVFSYLKQFKFNNFKLAEKQGSLPSHTSKNLKMKKYKENNENQFIQVLDYLSANYPHWTLNEIKIVSARVLRFYKEDYIKRGIKIIEFVSEGCAILAKRHANSSINCGYWLKKYHLDEVRNKIYKHLKDSNEWIENIENVYVIEQREFDDDKRIEIYAEEILKSNQLTPKQHELFELLIDLSNSNLEGDLYKTLNKVAIELGLIENNVSFRKAYQRLREKLVNPKNNSKIEELTFITKDSTDNENVIEFFFNTIDKLLIGFRSKLKAYRFSEFEMSRMNNLKNIFDSNNFITNRFPEVYIDEEFTFDDNDITNLNIDKFGCYKFNIFKANETEEGIVIIFTKAIESYSKIYGLNHNDVKLIVLMHELGHWFTHWSLFQNSNWAKGYGLERPITHETLAQIITYWAVKDIDEINTVFENNLTPSDEKNPYNLYKKIKTIDATEILMRLHHIRNKFNYEVEISDEECSKILLSNNLVKYSEMYRGTRNGLKYGI